MTISIQAARERFIARRNQLVEAFMYLVAPIAGNYARRLPPSFDLDDLTQAGYLGLIEAASTYSPKDHGGTPFEAWARIKIDSAIHTSIRRRHYTDATHAPIDVVPERGSESNVVEMVDRKRVRERIRSAVDQLGDRHRKVIALHDLGGEKLERVGAVLGVCGSRASQIHVEAIRVLRRDKRLKLDVA